MEKKYKKNFINNFIIRLDFDGKISDAEIDIVSQEFSKDFPFLEKQEVKNGNIAINPQEEEAKIVDVQNFVSQTRYDFDKTSRINIENSVAIFECLKYESFSKVLPFITKMMDALKEKTSVKQYKRIGVRYVNFFNIPMTDNKRDSIFEWDGFISKKIYDKENIFNKDKLLQKISITDLKIMDSPNIFCKIQYGILNRHFPAPLMEKLFLLDIDAFITEIIDCNEIEKNLNLIHDNINNIFEECIEEKMRKLLDE